MRTSGHREARSWTSTGNWRSGMSSIMFMIQMKKNSETRNGR